MRKSFSRRPACGFWWRRERSPDEQRLAETGISPGLVGIAVGVEDTEDPVDDVTSALDAVASTT